ncbi:Hypothetical protein Nlim_1710 [Candidatus Nitrosarchaeum limnium SFB1]|uniref:Uncharacterized protein n=1 Tax=Candidatus Nitrosarchaeum limnium SFB1 TaxID=886738 RepID=F3KMG0_9ARCH|nr:Hypothetical protein Nlim_1710 [Candidatus Nitrosarchaeum limnium SFB1]
MDLLPWSEEVTPIDKYHSNPRFNHEIFRSDSIFLIISFPIMNFLF